MLQLNLPLLLDLPKFLIVFQVLPCFYFLFCLPRTSRAGDAPSVREAWRWRSVCARHGHPIRYKDIEYFWRVKVPYGRVATSPLASRKGAPSDWGSEGSETAKAGTDGQEPHRRLGQERKAAHHVKARRQQS